MISRLVVLLAIFAGVFSAPAFADDLDAILSKAAAGQKAPGAGLLIIQDYAIIDEATYGVRSLSDPTPVSRSDVWNIGSDGKAMTAVMMAATTTTNGPPTTSHMWGTRHQGIGSCSLTGVLSIVVFIENLETG